MSPEAANQLQLPPAPGADLAQAAEHCFDHAGWAGEGLWLTALCEEEEERSGRAGGRPPKSHGKVTAAAKGAEALVVLQGQRELATFGGLDVSGEIDAWVDDNMWGSTAPATEKTYERIWDKWTWFARRRGWPSPVMNAKCCPKENEDKLLCFIGFLGWLGFPSSTLKQSVHGARAGHKRGGFDLPQGSRVTILLEALDRRAPRLERRLGATIAMLKWMSRQCAHAIATGTALDFGTGPISAPKDQRFSCCCA